MIIEGKRLFIAMVRLFLIGIIFLKPIEQFEHILISVYIFLGMVFKLICFIPYNGSVELQ